MFCKQVATSYHDISWRCFLADFLRQNIFAVKNYLGYKNVFGIKNFLA